MLALMQHSPFHGKTRDMAAVQAGTVVPDKVKSVKKTKPCSAVFLHGIKHLLHLGPC